MKKNNINILWIFFCFLIIFLVFKKYTLIAYSVKESISLFCFRVFPFLFIMIFINNMLINLGLLKYCNNYLYIFFMSILSGCPINATILADYLDKKFISEDQASKLLMCTNFNNPLFLYNYLNLIFHDSLVIFKILFLFYFPNLIIFLYLFFKNKKDKMECNCYSFTTAFNVSIKKCLESILNIFLVITLFKLLSDLVFNKYNLLTSLLIGLVEISNGFNSILKLSACKKIKELLVIIILHFSSFSIHIQISNILDKYNINYKYFYFSKIINIILSIIIIMLI